MNHFVWLTIGHFLLRRGKGRLHLCLRRGEGGLCFRLRRGESGLLPLRRREGDYVSAWGGGRVDCVFVWGVGGRVDCVSAWGLTASSGLYTHHEVVFKLSHVFCACIHRWGTNIKEATCILHSPKLYVLSSDFADSGLLTALMMAVLFFWHTHDRDLRCHLSPEWSESGVCCSLKASCLTGDFVLHPYTLWIRVVNDIA